MNDTRSSALILLSYTMLVLDISVVITAMLGLALVVVVGLIVRPGGAAEAARIWKRCAA